MSLGTRTTRLNNSRDVANVWITSGTTKLTLSKNFSGYTVSTKTDIGLKPGVSIAKQKESTSTKSNPLYSYFVNIKNIFFASERCVQNVQKSNSSRYYRHLGWKYSVSKWTLWTNLLILCVHVVTFLRKVVKNISI